MDLLEFALALIREVELERLPSWNIPLEISCKRRQMCTALDETAHFRQIKTDQVSIVWIVKKSSFKYCLKINSGANAFSQSHAACCNIFAIHIIFQARDGTKLNWAPL